MPGHSARSDSYLPGAPAVTEDGDEVDLVLRLVSGDSETCRPVAGAVIEIWHTGDSAEYDARRWRTTLRTDSEGYVTYRTLRPLSSEGAPHFHVRVADGPATAATEWVVQVPRNEPDRIEVDLVVGGGSRGPVAGDSPTDV